MLTITASSVQNAKVKYLGTVTGEVIIGANFFKDFAAGMTNFFGGRSTQYENSLSEARSNAVEEMTQKANKLGANAIIAMDLDYETITVGNSSMLMVACSGTAVTLEEIL